MLERAALFAMLALAGCSSDAVDVPEPTLETPGAFVAQEESATGDILLRRVTAAYRLENGQTVITFWRYEPRASSFDEAREIAKRHSLVIESASDYALEADFVQTNHRVVWFRTLGPDESP